MHVKDPADFLKQAIGKSVIVKLHSGFSYKGICQNEGDIGIKTTLPILPFVGTLICLDGFMNIAMENSEEYFGTRKLSSFKNIFIRGNNGSHYNESVRKVSIFIALF